MSATLDRDEYLAEMRHSVCAHCVEKPDGGPPCEPLGKMCGVEQHLPLIIDAMRNVQSLSLEPYTRAVHAKVCDHCSFRHGEFCPCPMDRLLALIADAVEAVDARHAYRDKGLRRIADVAESEVPDVREIRRLYRESAGTWRGCDWPTTFGKARLNLNGWSADDARSRARAIAHPELAADWQAAAEWLAKVEKHAEAAEQYAAQAVRAAQAGDWLEALNKARRAWASECVTGRMLWHGDGMAWRSFFLAVEAAVPFHPTQPDPFTWAK